MTVAIYKFARDTAANWTSVNPVMLDGEPAIEEDTGRLKFGNGVDAWADLPYFGGALSDMLLALQGMGASTGLVEQTGAHAFAKRAIGAAASTDILSRADGDGRYILSTLIAATNGLASLDSGGKVPTSQLPALAITSTFVVNSQAAQLALTTQEGDVAVRTDLNKTFIRNSGVAGTMADWQEMLTPTDTVISVNGFTGAVTITTITGNAGSATVLQNSRNIDGVPFNGGADIVVIAPATHAAASKATPVDADELPLVDSAAANVLKKLTWANLKATLKTYLDTLYVALSGSVMSGNIGRTTHVAGHLVGGFTNIGNNGAKTNPIFSVGTGNLPTSDTALGSMIGIGFAYANSSGGSGSTFTSSFGGAGSWGLYGTAGSGAATWFLDAGNGNIHALTSFRIGAVQVVGARKTGWAKGTGTATRTTFDTATVTLPQLAERMKALIDDLYDQHGLIGA
jgi:hypothetical protein